MAGKKLRQYEARLKVFNLEDAKAAVVPVVEDIIRRINRKDIRFEFEKIDYTGSIYQKLKIDKPDEFDFDLPIKSLEIENAPTETSSAEYTPYVLEPTQREEWKSLAVNGKGGAYLSSERILQTFAKLVQEVVSELNRERKHQNVRLYSKTNNPAVTLEFKKGGKILCNVDLVPTIKIKHWSDKLTQGWETRRRNGWPTADVLDKIMKGSFSLVPKLPKGVPIPERDIAWRYSFNNAEKVLFLDSEPGIANNCRRPVLRVLKGLRVDYKWPGIRSYHLKTVMLHEFESQSIYEWTSENFLPCLLNALRRLNVFLENKKCPHYFLPGINLFENITDEVSYTIRKDISLFLDNPEVALEKLLNNRVTVFVKNLDGRETQFMVNNEFSIDRVKEMVAAQERIDKSQCRLKYKGRNLDNGTIVGSYHIEAGSVIYMTASLRGGMV